MSSQQHAIGRLGTNQNVAFTGTAGTTPNPISAGVYKVRVMVTSAAYVRVDNNPTAANTDPIMAANFPETFFVSPGQKVSALQVSAAGTLSVAELA